MRSCSMAAADVLTAQVDRNRVHALLEFVLGDDVVVDNSDDSVEVDFVVGRGSLGFGSRLRGGVSRQRISRLHGLRAVHDRGAVGGKGRQGGSRNNGGANRR